MHFYQHNFYAKRINVLPAYLDAETITLLLFLLATVSRKCLPSAWRCLIILLSVNSLFYSLSRLRGRWRERGGTALWGQSEREGEREVKSVFRNVPWQASGRLSPDDWEGILGRGEAGEPRSTPPALSLSVTSPSTLQSALSFSSVHLCLQPTCLQCKKHTTKETHKRRNHFLCLTSEAWKTAEPTPAHFLLQPKCPL